jgi:ATP-dependent Clp protease protease subunit
VWINSPGGDVFAAAQIYNMLRDYKGTVTVKIDGLAASAASVIAVAGDEVLVSPVAMMMIHNPATIAMGNAQEMEKAIGMLNEVKESILNAYEAKTGLNRGKLSRMMDEETWFNAKKAVELGFADKILFSDNVEEGDAVTADPEEGKKTEDAVRKPEIADSMIYSTKAVSDSFLSKVSGQDTAGNQVSIEHLKQRLSLIAH